MLFPIGDDNTDRHRTPYITWLLIALNVFVFVYWQGLGSNIGFTFAYSTVPAEILRGEDIVTGAKIIEDPITGEPISMPGLRPTPIPVYLTLLTSMFMHGGIAHIAGNMLFLWIFGDNLENVMGHKKYLFFYLLCGVLAGLAHVFSSAWLNQSILVPSLGASGAISGVLAGYMLSFPRRQVHVWFLFSILSLPAFVVVGLWFVFQLINGMGMLGGEEAAGGVAYAAHIGGFIAGLLLVKFFAGKPQPVSPKRRSVW
ncbi:rhomboid family intramembrane serine protease [Terrimonas pollutisoli]|uniref:rhomboid family intramembrane serine protease n=1 Tax=Terrimonas pollutisoli TaxID=3034147 RepID=UPI0023EB104D|nr:rhomboid family intramembrane serine protease [Terrimonas sp. H1YJ31]